MNWKDLLDTIANQGPDLNQLKDKGLLTTPSPELLAFFVRWQRGMMGWKRETLASFAGVSLSTIERIERADPVSSDSLDRVADALGQPPGAFTVPRVPLSSEEAWQKLDDWGAPFDETVEVPVRPLSGHRQIAALATTHLCLVENSRIDSAWDADVNNLREWLGLASFIFASEEKGSIIHTNLPPVKRRELYKDILACVQEIERGACAVALTGTYQAETGHMALPKADVGFIGFFPKKTDPAAAKRKTLRAPARVDLAAAWERFLVERD